MGGKSNRNISGCNATEVRKIVEEMLVTPVERKVFLGILEGYANKLREEVLMKGAVWVTSTVVVIICGVFTGWPCLSEALTKKVTSELVKDDIKSYAKETVESVVSPQLEGFEGQLDQSWTELNSLSNSEESIRASCLELKEKLAEADDKLKIYGLIMAAQAGVRDSYKAIERLSAQTNELGKISADALKAIKAKYLSRKMSMNNGLYYSLELHPEILRDLPKEFHWVSIAYADCEWNSEGAVVELSKNRHNVAALVHVARMSRHLDSVYTAICGIERLTGERFDPLGVEQVLSWWTKNCDKADYHSVYEKYFNFLELGVGAKRPEESADQYAWRRIIVLDSLIKEDPGLYPAANAMFPSCAYVKVGPEEIKERNGILQRAVAILESHKKYCPQWDEYKAISLKALGLQHEVVEFLSFRMKEDPSFRQRVEKWPGLEKEILEGYKASMK